MPKRSSTKATQKKRPTDPNQLAKAILDEATGQAEKTEPPESEGKNPAAVALGRLGGKRGGPARAKKLDSETRSEIARKAARARWSKKKKP